MNGRMLYGIAAITSAAVLAACSASDTPAAGTKTKAQRDSAIANSGLPGAGGVAGALQAADSAKARQAAVDSASRP